MTPPPPLFADGKSVQRTDPAVFRTVGSTKVVG